MKAFSYDAPTTLDAAITLLDQAPDGAARPLAGGTDLLTLIKGSIAEPERLVNLKRIPDLPRGISETGDGLRIGTLTTLSEIEDDPAIRERYAAVAEAAGLAATPQLRNMATIGGNLLQRPRCWYFRNALVPCWLKGGDDCPAREGENQLHALFGGGPCYAVHPSDPASALVALGAELELRGPRGDRTLLVSELFALPEDERRTENVLADDELILALRLPALPTGTRSTYLKAMDRKVWAFALVGVAAALRFDEGRRIADARLVLSGVAPIPWRAAAAEQLLVGAEPDAGLWDRVADAALEGAEPLAHNGYKLPLARALIRRALQQLSA